VGQNAVLRQDGPTRPSRLPGAGQWVFLQAGARDSDRCRPRPKPPGLPMRAQARPGPPTSPRAAQDTRVQGADVGAAEPRDTANCQASVVAIPSRSSSSWWISFTRARGSKRGRVFRPRPGVGHTAPSRLANMNGPTPRRPPAGWVSGKASTGQNVKEAGGVLEGRWHGRRARTAAHPVGGRRC